MKNENVRVVLGGTERSEATYVATLGLEQRSQVVLANALNKLANGLCILANTNQSQVALIDLDNRNTKRLLNDFRKTYPSLPLIGIGKQQTELLMHAFIAKPVNLEQLLATIVELANPEQKQAKNMITEDKIAKAMQALENKNIAKSLHKRAEQNQPKSKAMRAMPDMTEEMCFDPERFLLGEILKTASQASSNKQTAILTCWHDRTIVIDPGQSKISSDLTDSQIRNLAIAPVDNNLSAAMPTKFYKSGEINTKLDTILNAPGMRHFTQEVFLWNLGLLTCRGRIPAEFAVCNRHYLKRWPNLTRVTVPSSAMRILAYWRQQPCSLMDIKEELDIPFQDVFNVFSAAYAAGLAGEAKRKSDQILQVVELNEHKQRGLMRSILNRLRGHKPDHISKTA
jgi:hypothetical protein